MSEYRVSRVVSEYTVSEYTVSEYRVSRILARCCQSHECVGAHVQDFCRVLSELHDKAPVHGWEASKAAIEKAFGLSVDQMFESIDHGAIASGSIAQVRHMLFTYNRPRCTVFASTAS